MAVRTLYLVRHGEYDHSDLRNSRVGKGLVASGKAQAELTGKWLAGLGVHFTAFHSSTYRRAAETAAIIATYLPHLALHRTGGLRECLAPGLHETREGSDGQEPGPDASPQAQSRAHVEAAFSRFFRSARSEDRHELLVCHGNLIRCLLHCALGIEPWGTMPLGTHNCGVTRVRIDPQGQMMLLTYNEIGHLPIELWTEPGG